MTLVLLVTDTADLAADLLVLELGKRGVPFLRFNQDRLANDIEFAWNPGTGASEIYVSGRRFAATDVTSCWYRHSRVGDREGEAKNFAERETLASLESFWDKSPWFWVNRPSAVRYASQKPIQLLAAQRVGLCIPQTCIANSPAVARSFVRAGPTIVKPLAGGRVSMGDREYTIFTTPITADDLDNDAALRACPAIYQRRVEPGLDVRVTVIGERLFGAAIHVTNRRGDEADWRAVEPARLSCERYDLPQAVAQSCRTLVRHFALEYAALDLMLDRDGRYFFLEINPSGHWGWFERRTGAPMTQALVDLLASAGPCG